jgi:hypothetical protein
MLLICSYLHCPKSIAGDHGMMLVPFTGPIIHVCGRIKGGWQAQADYPRAAVAVHQAAVEVVSEITMLDTVLRMVVSFAHPQQARSLPNLHGLLCPSARRAATVTSPRKALCTTLTSFINTTNSQLLVCLPVSQVIPACRAAVAPLHSNTSSMYTASAASCQWSFICLPR